MSEQSTQTRWTIIAVVFCMGVLMFIDRVNISIAGKYIMPEYNLTKVEMGSIFSAFVLGYALLQIPGGWLGDRFGPRPVLAGAICWWSAFTALTAVFLGICCWLGVHPEHAIDLEERETPPPLPSAAIVGHK